MAQSLLQGAHQQTYGTLTQQLVSIVLFTHFHQYHPLYLDSSAHQAEIQILCGYLGYQVPLASLVWPKESAALGHLLLWLEQHFIGQDCGHSMTKLPGALMELVA
jgi:hypothetical protein